MPPRIAPTTTSSGKPDYGVDAPAVMRNFFLLAALCLALALFLPRTPHLFRNVFLDSRSFFWPGGFLLAQALLFLLYVKVGKFRHRDFMLALHSWSGDETVLDVGCGRGLLLAGAAKRIPHGHATGIDIWSNVDMGGNSPEATLRNLTLEGVTDRTTLLSLPAQEMAFPDAAFDVIVSNLCLHNIYDRPTRLAALHQIVRVLKPGGLALLSDYKLTNEYAKVLQQAGLLVENAAAASSLPSLPSRSSSPANQPEPPPPPAHPKTERQPKGTMPMPPAQAPDPLREQLKTLLAGGQAHATFDAAVADFPAEHRATVPANLPYSAWQLLEHLRIAQHDILNFSAPPTGGYQPLEWPEAYWPKSPEPPYPGSWDNTIAAIHTDLEAFQALIANPAADLFKPFRWGQGQNLLREALLIADHNAYHLGELILLRRLLGIWKPA